MIKRNLSSSIVGFLAIALLVSTAALVPSGLVRAAQPKLSFAEDVLPILHERCVICHQPGGEGYIKSGLNLTSYEGLMKGTKHGPMVVPGDPETSDIMWLLDWRADASLRMPHNHKQLSTCDRNSIRNWIREGAKNN
jgi:hypothetical protein